MPAAATLPPVANPPATARMKPVSPVSELLFRTLCLALSSVVIVLVILVGYQLWRGAGDTFHKFGFGFLTKSDWDPNTDTYGALPFIYGTLVTSLLGLLIATPLAIATAVFLTEMSPNWLRQPLVFLIEMLAAIPSVILGLWAIFVLLPILNVDVFPFLKRTLGFLPIFSGVAFGAGDRRDGAADHHQRVARNPAFRAGPPTRGGLWSRCHPLGGDAHRRALLREEGHFRRDDSRPWTCAG